MRAREHGCAAIERLWLPTACRRATCGVVSLLGLLFAATAVPAQVTSPGKFDYNRDIRPILAGNCFACHGQDEAKRAKGLRLDRRDTAVKPLKNGNQAIVPRDPEASELIARITEEDDTLRMPPRKAGNRLVPQQIDALRRWIDQGAEYAPHWAFLAQKRIRFPG